MSRSRCAMTLIEVLAVVVILGLIATTVTMAIAGSIGEARHQVAISQISRIRGRLEAFHLRHGRFPDSGEGLHILTSDPQASWYLEPGQLNDPWGRPYLYVVPGPDGHPFEISTLGADGIIGGEGENADLSSTDLRSDSGR